MTLHSQVVIRNSQSVIRKMLFTRPKNFLYCFMFLIALASCGPGEKGERIPPVSPFDDDVAFLKKYSEVIELTSPDGKARVAVMPALQARVMTSTAGTPDNTSFGWINRPFFEAGDTSVHMNAFGGEERIWLGPEGGQFSIYFAPDSAFTFENWHTPRLIDLDPWDVTSRKEHSATFTKSATLTNYSRTVFNLKLNREVKVLSARDLEEMQLLPADTNVSFVAYQTINDLQNAGLEQWIKEKGLLSIWLLGMFNPSPGVTMVIPFEPGSHIPGPIVSDDYFGKVPTERLKVSDSVIFFRGDGEYRSKIGLNARRAKGIMGSYDATTRTLTIVKYSTGEPDDVYVNSKWEIQRNPYSGDVVNAYNDGPPAPGAKPMGPFYELESSSPARELKPGESVRHVQTTVHFQGDDAQIDNLARRLLGTTLGEIKGAF